MCVLPKKKKVYMCVKLPIIDLNPGSYPHTLQVLLLGSFYS